MSEVMTCMPFEQLMNWVLEEKKTKGTVFGQHRAYVAEADKKLNIFERNFFCHFEKLTLYIFSNSSTPSLSNIL